jgi:c-di-GMP-binding flagellar brake protein YcgR
MVEGRGLGEEKRRFKRVKVSFVVFYRVNFPWSVRLLVGEKEVDAMALDLSEGGLAILTNYNISVSSRVMIKFILLDDYAIRREMRSKSMEVQGEVCYSFLTDEKAFRIGIRFINIAPEDRNFIAGFVKKRVFD